jgi:hypothetical protein
VVVALLAVLFVIAVLAVPEPPRRAGRTDAKAGEIPAAAG